MARLQYTIKDEIKEKAERFLQQQGIPPAIGISMFYIEVINNHGLPFEPSKIETPNQLTAKTIENADKGIDIIECENVNDMFDKLNNN